jgi:cobyrinic acid a,c-diamide synthase
VIAGLAGDSGKTLVTMGLCAAFRARGLAVTAFKKGPDYIDAAWLRIASGSACRNLDTFLHGPELALESFRRHAAGDLNLCEGNRGLLDGVDVAGTHSTASLARILEAPVLLVVGASKVTRTVAAGVKGCLALEPGLRIAGVVLNQIGGARHADIARRAVEELTGVPVLGVLPRVRETPMPGRHLGLVPPEEHGHALALRGELARLVGDHVELERVLELARSAPPMHGLAPDEARPAATVRVGVFSDSAFTFYYPENLEALERAGAELVLISGLADTRLPEVDALYLGGGFPETHAARLAANTGLHAELRAAVEAGLPVHAECGGLIYLARSLRSEAGTHAFAGVLPLDLELCARPEGHGYVELTVDGANPVFAPGTELRGHEFHYTRIVGRTVPDGLGTAFALRRGTGCGGGRDGVVHKNVLACYTHLHAVGTPGWAPALVDAARAHRRRRRSAGAAVSETSIQSCAAELSPRTWQG